MEREGGQTVAVKAPTEDDEGLDPTTNEVITEKLGAAVAAAVPVDQGDSLHEQTAAATAVLRMHMAHPNDKATKAEAPVKEVEEEDPMNLNTAEKATIESPKARAYGIRAQVQVVEGG